MDQSVYVCIGTCKAEVSQAQYNEGLTRCGTKTCTMYGQSFEERERCAVCGALYRPGEEHKH